LLIKTTKYLLAILIIILTVAKTATGQNNNQVSRDTISSDSDTTSSETDTTSIVYRHNPARAAFLSAVVPGLGQIYNGKGLFWRLPLLYAGIAFEIYFISYMNNQYQIFHSDYVNYSTYINNLGGNNFNPAYVYHMVSNTGIFGYSYIFSSNSSNFMSNLKFYNDYYKQYLDLNIIILGGIYFLNIIDATVTAYFFDYNISDDLTLKIRPAILNNSISNIGTLGLKISFNLRK
jgi:hypothetical protein